MAAGERREIAAGIEQLMAKMRRRFAGGIAPQPCRATLGVAGGKPLRGRDMGGGEIGERYALAADEVEKPAEAMFQAVDESPQERPVAAGEGGAQPDKAGGRARAADLRFEAAGAVAEQFRREPAGGERMLQCC